MSFRFAQYLLFRGRPLTCAPFHMENGLTTGSPSPFVSYATTDLVVSEANVEYAFSTTLPSVVEDPTFFIWDMELLLDRLRVSQVGQVVTSYTWTGVLTEEIIDATLDALEELYIVSKAVAADYGYPDILIGQYSVPCPKSYYIPVLAVQEPGNATYQSNLAIYRNDYARINQRWNGSSYTDYPYSQYADFVMPDIYPFFGDDDEWYQYMVNEMLDLSRTLAGEKPLMPIMYMYYHPSAPWTGKALNAAATVNVINLCKAKADGIFMWGGFVPSALLLPRYVPDGSKTLSDWQSITNGSFAFNISGYTNDAYTAVTGVNFSGAASMDDVASILQTAINNKVTTSINSLVPVPLFLPYKTGPVTVTWTPSPTSPVTGPAFHFSNAGGVGFAEYGSSIPPDNAAEGRTAFSIRSYAPGGTTDVGVAAYIGTYFYRDGELTNINADEWENGWVVGTDWWNVYTSAAENESRIPDTVDLSVNAEGNAINVSW